VESSYTPEGVVLGTVDAFTGADRIRIVDTRQHIRLKIDMLEWSCSCRHENRQATFFDEGGDADSERFSLVVFCAEETRESYPNCAHVQSYGLDPDPFGKEVRELVQLGVLDPVSWYAWLTAMRFRILAVDNQVSRSLVQMDGQPIIPLPEGVTAKTLQQPNIDELKLQGALLLSVTSRSLGLAA